MCNVRPSITFMEFIYKKVLVKVSPVMYISVTTYQNYLFLNHTYLEGSRSHHDSIPPGSLHLDDNRGQNLGHL